MRQEEEREATGRFEQTLREVIQLAQGSMSASNAQRRGAVDVEAKEEGPQSELRRSIEMLDPDAALKVRTLMIAGRDGKDVAAVRLDATLGGSEAAFVAAARDASENGALLADYLRRGYALACAEGIDLESAVEAWAPKRAPTLDERAWRSFGMQLASSEPDDWQFIGRVEPGRREIIRLYVRLRGHGWWSFQSLLDRPSIAFVGKEKRALASRRTKGVMAWSLRKLAARLDRPPEAACGGPTSKGSKKTAEGWKNSVESWENTAESSKKTAESWKNTAESWTKSAEISKSPVQGRALRRALRAIRARVGKIGPRNAP